MYHILLVDDEENIRTFIKKYALFEGHRVTEASGGMEAVSLCRENQFDLIVLDVMMEDLDGFSVCRKIREFSSVPIIMLTARGEEYDKIHGFEMGVDDYVVKPFSPKELMLRIEAVMKRVQGTKKKEEKPKEEYWYESLHIDFAGRIVSVDGERLNLSPKEYDLLFYLVRNRNLALPRETLICEVWGYDFFGGDRTLDTHIKLLRKSLGKYGARIVTLRGAGYRFEG